jgi:hypothetical protein
MSLCFHYSSLIKKNAAVTFHVVLLNTLGTNIPGTTCLHYIDHWCFPWSEANTVEPRYNNVGLCDTWSIASDILWYQLIPHCYHDMTLPR